MPSPTTRRPARRAVLLTALFPFLFLGLLGGLLAAQAPGSEAARARRMARGVQEAPSQTPDPVQDRVPAVQLERAAEALESLGRIPSFEQLRRGDFEGVLHGTGPLWSRAEHDGYRAALADTPPLILRYGINLVPPRHSYESTLGVLRDDLRTYADEIPLITVQFHLKRGDNPTIGYDKQVAAGEHDDRILALADLLIEHGGPVFVRVGAEVNGPWNGYDPQHFSAAYRRIVQLMRKRDPERFIFVWNIKSMAAPEYRYGPFYPGDDVVDWWSLDLFGEDFGDPRINRRVHQFLRDARARGKPVMFPECAPSELDIDERYTWNHWFVPFFELLENDDNIKAFCYSNRDFANRDVTLTHWGDMRLDGSGNLERYREQLRRPIYIHGPAPVPEGVEPPSTDRPRLRVMRQNRAEREAREAGEPAERRRGTEGEGSEVDGPDGADGP